MAAKEQEFHLAIQQNDAMKVQMLLDQGVSVNCYFCDMSPVQLAILRGHQELAVLLIEKNCNINVHGQHDRYLFEEAFMNKQLKVVASLLTRKISPNVPLSFGDSPLCIAVELCCPELVKVLMDGNANVNSVNLRNESALYIACEEGHIEIARKLILAGADVNFVHHNSDSFTPLLIAVANDNKEIVVLLLKRNVYVNAQDVDGWTPLWHSYCNCNEEICILLLKAGAKVDVPNNEGKTVVEEAHENEDDDFILLFSKFAQLNTLLNL